MLIKRNEYQRYITYSFFPDTSVKSMFQKHLFLSTLYDRNLNVCSSHSVYKYNAQFDCTRNT